MRTSPASIVVFVVTALALLFGAALCQLSAWFAGQIALSSFSAEFLIWFDRFAVIAQSIVLLVIVGPLALASRNPRFRSVYQGWLIAALFGFPATALRFIPVHLDQLGALAQTVLVLVASGIVIATRSGRRSLPPIWSARGALTALAAAPLAVWPFIRYGALGSPLDALLNLIAGLAFGVFSALLIAPTEENTFLKGLGLAVTMAMIGSAFGYDGNQLLLVAVVPALGFAAAALSSSLLAPALLIGLAAAAPLIFFDPTELTILLGGGEILTWASRAGFIMAVSGLALGIALWLIKLITRPRRIPTALPLAGAVAAWAGAAALFITLGQPGFHGERLFVILKDQADVSSATQIADRNDRLKFVYETLTAHANGTQADLRQTLDRFGIRYTPYYLVNGIEVQGGPLLRLYLLTRPEVDRVLDSPRLRPLPEPIPVTPGSERTIAESPGWNIKMIGADKVWNEFGVTGQGIVVGQSDSGVDGSHPALADAYRGRSQGDDYNWFDPWDGTTSPNDEGGHGTHTLGTILGSRGIGVAPGAEWMGCVNLNRNLGNPPLYLDCMQFMLAPFPHGGDPFKDGDPTRAAHVLNNSWGCPPIEGCDANALRPAADALRAAGLFVVVSTGNDGPNCSTVASPPSLYDSVFSVGAVDQNGNLADFSSRGPVTADGSDRVKPDIAAPGVDVFSSLPQNTYGANSGTSMAGPHLVGVVALLWSANPDLIGDIDRTEQIIVDTARPYRGDRSVGCFEGSYPDDAVGYGIVDAYAAVKMALGK